TPSTWPNAAHTPGEKIPAAVRSAPASPNSEIPSVWPGEVTAGLPLPIETASSAVAVAFTFASAKPDAVRSCAGPQQGAVSWLISHGPELTHFRTVNVALPLLLPSKSYTKSRSPAVRCTSGEPPGQAVVLWLNSNPTCVEEL